MSKAEEELKQIFKEHSMVKHRDSRTDYCFKGIYKALLLLAKRIDKMEDKI